MTHFDHPCFQKFSIDRIPLERDLYLMGADWMSPWEAEYIKLAETGSGDPYNIGYIAPASAHSITSAGVDLSWYPNVNDRFHEVKIMLPREAFVVAVEAWNYDKRTTIFVRTEWLRRLHLRSNSIFGMIDTADMTKAMALGHLSREKLIELRDRIDALAAGRRDISFISFADSLLLKTNWQVGMVDTDVTYSYRPEALFHLFRELREIYRAVLRLDIYAIFAQGSNEYYDDPLTHLSAAGNHFCFNSLGLPFAQIKLIEDAARNAIRRGEHGRYDIYMDEDFFYSLQFADYEARARVPHGSYQPKMTSCPGHYFFSNCDPLLKQLSMGT
jgi:hypothetical protein